MKCNKLRTTRKTLYTCCFEKGHYGMHGSAPCYDPKKDMYYSLLWFGNIVGKYCGSFQSPQGRAMVVKLGDKRDM
jgi:hypothetical protein